MNIKVRDIFLIILTAAMLFIPFLGAVHLFDWDEINFAECSREMLLLHDYTRVYIDFKPFWEKPPMFIWMQAFSMSVFGVGEFAARFPNALCGICTLVVVYLVGNKLLGRRFGLLWAAAFAGSIFPNMYFKSGIIDPFFNLFIFLSFVFFICYNWKRNIAGARLRRSAVFYIICSATCMGLAILMKGQAALLIFMLSFGVYWVVYQRFRIFWAWKDVFIFLLTCFIVTLTWYGYETAKNGPWFISEFMRYQYRLFSTHDAGQKGFPGYHYVVLLIGCFPASALALRSFFRNSTETEQELDFKRWMLVLFWVVTILFTIVQSRIIHYSSMAWFPLTFLAAYGVHNIISGKYRFPAIMQITLIVIGSTIGIALAVFPWVAAHAHILLPYIKDEFAKANLQAQVHWTGFEGLTGIFYLVILFTGFIWIRKGRARNGAMLLFGGTAFTIFLASVLIVPRVERFSQGAAIDFFEQRQGEDCYVQVLGYKSYAHLFYTRKTKPAIEDSSIPEWLLMGKIDKPAYFVTKIHRLKDYTQFTEVKELYRKNGFVFLKREVPATQ